jgi:enolase-phosphatase E1
VLAQKLLFAHTVAGDLTRYIDGFFDTTIGRKIEVDSYLNIANALQAPPKEVLFISDVVKELNAAREAGMQTLLCVRPGNQPQETAASYQSIHSFSDIENPER